MSVDYKVTVIDHMTRPPQHSVTWLDEVMFIKHMCVCSIPITHLLTKSFNQKMPFITEDDLAMQFVILDSKNWLQQTARRCSPCTGWMLIWISRLEMPEMCVAGFVVGPRCWCFLRVCCGGAGAFESWVGKRGGVYGKGIPGALERNIFPKKGVDAGITLNRLLNVDERNLNRHV